MLGFFLLYKNQAPAVVGHPLSLCSLCFNVPTHCFFFFLIHRVAGHPLGHGGGSTTSRPAGLVVAEPSPVGGSATLLFHFFFSLTGGGPATPLGNWGGSATTRPAGLVVAEPPQWPKGWPTTPCGWIGHPSSFTFFFLKKKNRFKNIKF
jgi:hypothetical protein